MVSRRRFGSLALFGGKCVSLKKVVVPMTRKNLKQPFPFYGKGSRSIISSHLASEELNKPSYSIALALFIL